MAILVGSYCGELPGGAIEKEWAAKKVVRGYVCANCTIDSAVANWEQCLVHDVLARG